MKEESKIKSLDSFQKQVHLTFRSLGFSANVTDTIFSIIIEMRNIVVAAEKEDTILLHKHIGLCSQALANYATVNSLKFSDCIKSSYNAMEISTQDLDMEYYLEKVKDELSFVSDMHDKVKIEFIQKCWISIFVDDYHDDFIKIDRILKAVIEDNKIKFPQHFK